MFPLDDVIMIILGTDCNSPSTISIFRPATIATVNFLYYRGAMLYALLVTVNVHSYGLYWSNWIIERVMLMAMIVNQCCRVDVILHVYFCQPISICSNSNALAMELLQSCTKPSICPFWYYFVEYYELKFTIGLCDDLAVIQCLYQWWPSSLKHINQGLTHLCLDKYGGHVAEENFLCSLRFDR